MKFLKQNIVYLVIIGLLATYIFVPGVKTYINSKIFPIQKIEDEVHISDTDYQIKLKGINTTSTNLENFKGKKMVFLNFWGTWCPPCREEMPSIQKLYDSKKEKIDFVLIAMQDEEEKVKEFMQKNNYTIPVYIAESPISEKLLPKVFPTTYILDKNGRILMKETSSKDWNQESVHRLIDSMNP